MSGALRVCAVIPARGGSKGIPGKNLRPLGGRPLLAHSIEAAQQAPAIGRVVVSTDDPAIAEVALGLGAGVVERPADLSGDTASSESALLHALDHLRDHEAYEPDLVVFLQATSPLRRPDDVQQALDTLVRDDADSLFSGYHPAGFVWRTAAGVTTPLDYDPAHRPRRQDFEKEILVENGSIYVFKPWVLRQTGSRLGGRIAVHLMHPNDSFEIDEPEDLMLLESLAVQRPAGGSTP